MEKFHGIKRSGRISPRKKMAMGEKDRFGPTAPQKKERK